MITKNCAQRKKNRNVLHENLRLAGSPRIFIPLFKLQKDLIWCFLLKQVCVIYNHGFFALQVTIKKTLQDFKRTHQDNWQDHKLKFSDDQLAVLTDLLVSPSYYAWVLFYITLDYMAENIIERYFWNTFSFKYIFINRVFDRQCQQRS